MSLILLKTLFQWADAFQVSQFSTMSQFVAFCSSFRLQWGPFLYTSCVLGLRPFVLFNDLLIYQKKKYQRHNFFFFLMSNNLLKEKGNAFIHEK